MAVNYGRGFTISNLDPQIWLDASTSQWNDISKYGRNPVLQTGSLNFISGPNNLPVVNANGEYWNIDLDWTNNSEHTVYAVMKPITFSNLYGAATGGAGSASLHVGWNNVTSYRMNFWSNDWYPTYSLGSNFIIVAWTWGVGGVKTIYNNNILVGNTTQGFLPTTPLGGGRLLNVVSQGIMSCNLAEVIFFSKAHNKAIVGKVTDHLNNKWKIY